MTLVHPTEDWEPALSPSSSMTRGGAARKWPNQMFWGGYARPPFVMLWCRSVPLPEQRHFSVFCLPAQHLWPNRLQTALARAVPPPCGSPASSTAGSGTSWLCAKLELLLMLTFFWAAPFLIWKIIRRFPMLISPCGSVHAFTSCRFPLLFEDGRSSVLAVGLCQFEFEANKAVLFPNTHKHTPVHLAVSDVPLCSVTWISVTWGHDWSANYLLCL